MRLHVRHILIVLLILISNGKIFAQSNDSLQQSVSGTDSSALSPAIDNATATPLHPADSNITNTSIKDSTSTRPEVITAPAQSASYFRPRNLAAGEVAAFFNDSSQQLNSRERFVTNALRIYNNKTEPVTFTIEIVAPKSWKQIGSTEKEYTLQPGDSMVIPVRLIPGIGSAEVSAVNVQALLVSNEQELLSDAMFGIHRKKNIRWTVSSEEGTKIYFPVNDSIVPFSINVNNDGNEKIDLLLYKKQLGNRIYVADEAENRSRNNYHELNLEPLEDTTLRYTAALQHRFETDRRIDVENYTPTAMNEEIRNTIFFQSQLSNNTEGTVFSGYRRMDFVRLSDEKTVNPFGSSVIPLTMDLNTYNILGIQPVMRLDLRGNTILNNEALLSYQTLFNFTNYRYSNEITNDVFYRVAYIHRKGDLQFGNISGGLSLIPVSGRGVSGSYFVTPSLRTGAFYVRNTDDNRSGYAQAYGGFMRYQLKNIGTSTLQVGRSEFDNAGRTNNYAALSNSVRLMPNQQVNFGIAVSRNSYDNAATQTGYSYFGGYTGAFLKKKLNTNLRAAVFSSAYSASRLPSQNFFHRSSYTVSKKLTVILQNTLNRYQQYTILGATGPRIQNEMNYNQLFFNFGVNSSRIMPGIFWNQTRLNNFELLYRGVSLDYSKSSISGRSRFGASLIGGYNTLPQYRDIPAYFTMQVGITAQHKTMSFNGRYFYGPQYVSNAAAVNNTLKYPQALFLSLSKQFQPENKSIVFQGNASYTYMNQYNRHTIGIFPEAYYFTRSKWRFKLSAGYSFNASKTERSNNNTPGIIFPEEEVRKVVTHNFFLNAGVRKEFGIPVPKKLSKKKFATMHFQAFLDVNGNRVKDKNEIIIKNVVIRVGNDEVITNENGEAVFKNVGAGKYAIRAMSLYDLKGWYPLLSDSISADNSSIIAIPFVKGIRLNGNVVLQKAKFSSLNENADLSRILISATDSAGKEYQALTDQTGAFSIYLPPGKYKLTMDEGIVGRGFAVLKNNVEIELSNLESYNYNFYILEKKRKVNMKKF